MTRATPSPQTHGKDPVEDDETSPDVASLLGVHLRCTEVCLEDIEVDDLDADVAVEHRCDLRGDDSKDVCGDLELLVEDGQSWNDVAVLSLGMVDDAAINEVNDEDERLGGDRGLPEGQRLLHLGHKLDEDLCDISLLSAKFFGLT